MSTDQWFQLIERFGVPLAILLVILYTGYKKVWVWGYQLKDAQVRETEWKDLALTGTKIAETVASSKERQVLSTIKDILEKNG